jgi:hypothetical protein
MGASRNGSASGFDPEGVWFDSHSLCQFGRSVWRVRQRARAAIRVRFPASLPWALDDNGSIRRLHRRCKGSIPLASTNRDCGLVAMTPACHAGDRGFDPRQSRQRFSMHEVVKCSKCGIIIRQCRCASPDKHVSYEVCEACKCVKSSSPSSS